MLAVKLLQRYLLSTPCVRKNDVWRLLEVHEFYEVQGIEVKKTHLVREAGSLANSGPEIRCDCGYDEGTEQKRLCQERGKRVERLTTSSGGEGEEEDVDSGKRWRCSVHA
jgi:hypothetical protein